MYVDLVNSNNYLSINISLIQSVGLNAAVYISELMNILKKAVIKGKLLDGSYVKVDRRFISRRTTLTPDTQREIDANLQRLDLLVIHPTLKDAVSVNSLGIVALISTADEECEKESLAAMREAFKSRVGSESSVIKGRAIAKKLKQSITTGNTFLRSRLNAWVDAMQEKTALTKETVVAFQETVLKYSTDVDVVKELIDIAVRNHYAYGELAIQDYEKAKKDVRGLRVTRQRRATVDDLEKGVVF